MNAWLLAAIVLLAALLPCVAVCALSHETHALAAVELASVLLTSVLLLLSEGLHRQPFVDLGLTFAFVSLIGSLAFARMLEREL
jgi:multisubunit Na+/H+ antiporter MnhF subunit